MDKGLDAPRAPRMRSDAGAMRQQQRQNLAMRSAITQQNRGAGRQARFPYLLGSEYHAATSGTFLRGPAWFRPHSTR